MSLALDVFLMPLEQLLMVFQQLLELSSLGLGLGLELGLVRGEYLVKMQWWQSWGSDQSNSLNDPSH